MTVDRPVLARTRTVWRNEHEQSYTPNQKWRTSRRLQRRMTSRAVERRYRERIVRPAGHWTRRIPWNEHCGTVVKPAITGTEADRRRHRDTSIASLPPRGPDQSPLHSLQPLDGSRPYRWRTGILTCTQTSTTGLGLFVLRTISLVRKVSITQVRYQSVQF